MDLLTLEAVRLSTVPLVTAQSVVNGTVTTKEYFVSNQLWIQLEFNCSDRGSCLDDVNDWINFCELAKLTFAYCAIRMRSALTLEDLMNCS